VKSILICFVLCVSCVLLSYADTIKLKDGTTVTGKVIGSNDSTVMLQDDSGNIVNISKNNIQESSVTNAVRTNKAAAVKSGQEQDNFDEETRNLVFFGGGGALTSFGVLGSFTGGYEYLINPNFAGNFTFSVWPLRGGVMFLYDVSILVHFSVKKTFDPFIGIGLASAASSLVKGTFLDLPVTAGVNFWFNKSFALRIQDKLYLLSMSTGLNEVTGQLVFAF
jgi:hypothetical protein